MNSEKPEIISRSKDKETLIVQKAYIVGGEYMVRSLVLCVNLIGGGQQILGTWLQRTNLKCQKQKETGNPECRNGTENR